TQLARMLPAVLRLPGGSAVRGALAVVVAAAHAWPLEVLAVAMGLAWAMVRRRRLRRDPPIDTSDAAHRELLAALAALGHPPDASKTPAEMVETVRSDPRLRGEASEHASVARGSGERARFARAVDRQSEAEATRALASATRVRELVRHR